jgi:hypothetical protein
MKFLFVAKVAIDHWLENVKKKSDNHPSLHFWRMKNLQIHLNFFYLRNLFGILAIHRQWKNKGWRGGVGWLHFFSILTTASRCRLHILLGSHFPPRALLYPSAVLKTLQDFRLWTHNSSFAAAASVPPQQLPSSSSSSYKVGESQ